MAGGNIQLQPGRRPGRRAGGAPPRTILPLRRASHLSNSISCWYCDFKFSVFNEPLFHFGQKYSRWLRIWFSAGMGFSLTTLIGVTVIIILESARALNLYNGIPWLNSILNGSIFGSYSSVFRHSVSVTDVGYICISSIISISIHELGHAIAAAREWILRGIHFVGSSEGIQIEYTAVFLAVLFPGALVAFNHELLQMMPRVATLRIYCAGIWHNAALCAVCALTVVLLPVILYPLYSHGESLMVLDVSAKSPLSGYLSPGDLITKLDGKCVHTTKEWIEMTYLLDQQIFETTKHYRSKKGYCVPNLVIAESKNAEIIDNQFTCPNEFTLFTTISCVDSSAINETDHQQTREHIFCLPAKGVLGKTKCGDGWVNIIKNDSNCPCMEDESCSTPIEMAGQAWVEITFSRPQCQTIQNNDNNNNNNNSSSAENSCSGTFVFIGDMVSMAHSIRLTEYKFRWWYGVIAHIPCVIEKLLVNTFHVSLMLALLNSLPVYYLDGESILEVGLCCFGSLTPTIREALVRSSLLAGTLICFLLILKILLLVS